MFCSDIGSDVSINCVESALGQRVFEYRNFYDLYTDGAGKGLYILTKN